MIKQLKVFFQNFFARSGLYVLISVIIARIFSFLASWIALQLIPGYELGLVIYSINIISLVIPISGFGAYQGLLRYGALQDNDYEKNRLFIYVIKKGSLFTFLLIGVLFLFNPILTGKLIDARPYLTAVSLSIYTLFLMENLKVQFRILGQNKNFAKIEIIYNFLLVILVFTGSFFIRSTGYIIALILTPFITFLIFLPQLKLKKNNFSNIKNPGIAFWKYSFFASLSSLATQFLIIMDIILIGIILQDPEKVTIYKYLSLIPFSILFLPRAMISTDFVELTKRHKDKVFMKHYITNYTIIFSAISLMMIIFSFMFSENILSFFGNDFIKYKSTFLILILGISSILVLRGLYGNLLSTLGKTHLNYWISFTGILINVIGNYYLIPRYGILGAGITSAVIMWITSILTALLYYYFYRRMFSQR